MIRIAGPEDAELLAALHDQWRHDWPEFSRESADGVRSAITDDGMLYLVLDDRATVCLYADSAHAYGYLDFPYAAVADAPALIGTALEHLSGLRVECPLPAERKWEAQMLVRHGFTPGRKQRRMTLDRWPVGQPLTLPDGVERATVFPDEVEALHNLAFRGSAKLPGWRTDPGIFPVIGLRTSEGVAGYALAALHAGVFWLWELAVHPHWRRRGLGRALTVLALNTLRDAGAEEVHVHVNDNHDQHAPILYQSVGFQTVHLITRYVRQK